MDLGGTQGLWVNKRSGAGKRMSASVRAALLFAVAALAQAHRENGWVSLFNGKDLTGWKINGEERLVAENGTILCESTAGKYGYLTTEKTYRDFDLRLKFKGEAAGNSGLFFHSKITGMNPQTGPDIQAMQVEVDPHPGKDTGGALREWRPVVGNDANGRWRKSAEARRGEKSLCREIKWSLASTA